MQSYAMCFRNTLLEQRPPVVLSNLTYSDCDSVKDTKSLCLSLQERCSHLSLRAYFNSKTCLCRAGVPSSGCIAPAGVPRVGRSWSFCPCCFLCSPGHRCGEPGSSPGRLSPVTGPVAPARGQRLPPRARRARASEGNAARPPSAAALPWLRAGAGI